MILLTVNYPANKIIIFFLNDFFVSVHLYMTADSQLEDEIIHQSATWKTDRKGEGRFLSLSVLFTLVWKGPAF